MKEGFTCHGPLETAHEEGSEDAREVTKSSAEGNVLQKLTEA